MAGPGIRTDALETDHLRLDPLRPSHAAEMVSVLALRSTPTMWRLAGWPHGSSLSAPLCETAMTLRDDDGDGDGEEIWILEAPNSSGDIGTEHGAE